MISCSRTVSWQIYWGTVAQGIIQSLSTKVSGALILFTSRSLLTRCMSILAWLSWRNNWTSQTHEELNLTWDKTNTCKALAISSQPLSIHMFHILLASFTCDRRWIRFSRTMQNHSTWKHSYESTKHWCNIAGTLTRPILQILEVLCHIIK